MIDAFNFNQLQNENPHFLLLNVCQEKWNPAAKAPFSRTNIKCVVKLTSFMNWFSEKNVMLGTLGTHMSTALRQKTTCRTSFPNSFCIGITKQFSEKKTGWCSIKISYEKMNHFWHIKGYLPHNDPTVGNWILKYEDLFHSNFGFGGLWSQKAPQRS